MSDQGARFLDGPAAGQLLPLRTCPQFLRVVVDPIGKVDVLDQPEDFPRDNETIFAYRMVENTFRRVWVRAQKREASGAYDSGDYKLIVPQPSEPALLSRGLWVDWVKNLLRSEGVEI
jgi:hypothetical protein